MWHGIRIQYADSNKLHTYNYKNTKSFLNCRKFENDVNKRNPSKYITTKNLTVARSMSQIEDIKIESVLDKK